MNLKHTTVECAKIPPTHHNKVGWFENHQKHICLTKWMRPTTLRIGDSIVVGLLGTRIFGKIFEVSKNS